MEQQVMILDEAVDAALEHSEAKIERATKSAYYEVGLELRHIRDERLYRNHYKTFEGYCQNRWEMTHQRADQLIAAATTVEKMTTIVVTLPAKESHVRPLLKLDNTSHQVEAWQRAIDSADGRRITAKDISAEVERKLAELKKDWITVSEWESLSTDDYIRILSEYDYSAKKTFNQVNENIEWAMWSWNPVTGCLRGCEYCYARDIAMRFNPQEFIPSFYPDRLAAPENTAVPSPRRVNDIGHKGVFVCSMADLFGNWVPEEWISAVLDTIENNPQWTFLLLTKFPENMAEFVYASNIWLGTTVDTQAAVERAEKGFAKIKDSGFASVCWLSCEPMMESLTFSSLEMFDWLVMGGASRSSQTPEYKPPFRDITHLCNQADAHNIPIYQKTNLIPGMSDDQRLREYPNAVEILDQALPRNT